MGDLSSFLPTETATVTAIYEFHKKQSDQESPRNYLGASSIGHECDRALWFGFRQCVREEFDGRMHRLFETGHLAEDRFIRELEGIGCTVKAKDESGEQFGVSEIGGHFKGHLDAVILGVPEAPKTWHLGEFKTHNDKSFESLKKLGVKAAKKKHYVQMIVYMGLAKLDRALYLAVNKNTDELYSERIEHNPAEFHAIMLRAERIIKAQQPPERCSSRSDDFRCKFCSGRDLCWGTGSAALPLAGKSCRFCCHATPEMDGDGRWSCNILGNLASCPKEACGGHLILPGLITFADVCDAGADWIEFQNHKDGAHWRHGDGRDGTWSTEELMRTPGPLVGEKAVQAAKEVFGGTVTGFEVPTLSLIQKYDPKDSRLLWEGDDVTNGGTTALGAALGLDEGTRLPEPTATQNDKNVEAYEFAGKYLLVIYKNDVNYAAVWEGVE